MKKFLLIGAVAIFGAMNAQVKFGMKAGYANSTIVSDELEQSLGDEFGIDLSKKSKSGFFVGAFAEYMITDKFSVQGEIQYANLGGKLEGRYDDSSLRFTIVDEMNFNQVLIPITGKFYPIPELAIYAGPSLAFNAGYKVNMELEDTNIPEEYIGEIEQEFTALENEQEEAMEDNLKSTNVNVLFGAEYTIFKGLFIDARYTVGLSNYEEEPYEDSKTTLNYLQVGLGYKF